MPEADMIIHAGDISSVGTKQQVLDFLVWFSSLPYKYKIFVSGNHDFFFDYGWNAKTPIGKSRFEYKYAKLYTKSEVEELLKSFPNVIYLNDNGVEIEGIKIYGSPISIWFHDWGFNRNPGEEIKQHWDLIPDDTDILITHGTPYGILDKTIQGDLTGCKELLKRVQKIKPSYHIMGHIHEAAGIQEIGATTFINASVLDENYKMKNKPIVITI